MRLGRGHCCRCWSGSDASARTNGGLPLLPHAVNRKVWFLPETMFSASRAKYKKRLVGGSLSLSFFGSLCLLFLFRAQFAAARQGRRGDCSLRYDEYLAFSDGDGCDAETFDVYDTAFYAYTVDFFTGEGVAAALPTYSWL